MWSVILGLLKSRYNVTANEIKYRQTFNLFLLHFKITVGVNT